MTPARRQKLITAIDLIQQVTCDDAWAARADSTRNALIGMGARFINGNTNTMRLAGVTASCAWDKGEHLLTRWAAGARTALEQDDQQDGAGEEEE
jgi:hypothetical protein